MMVVHKDVPWWADYLKEAMRSWGLAVVIVLVPLLLVSFLAYSRGGQWIDAKLSSEKAKLDIEASNANTNATVAQVVQDLASELKQTQSDIKHNREVLDAHTEVLAEAKTMMQGAPARGEKMIALLEELVLATKTRQPNP